MKKILFNSLLILAVALFAGCNKKETDTQSILQTEEPVKIEGCIEYTGPLYIKVGTQSESVADGTIEACFDDGTFELFGGNDMDIAISFDKGYTGKGTYTFSGLEALGAFVEASGTNEDFDTYDWEPGLSGSITISENTADKISGKYEFKGTDGNVTKTVKGDFDMKKL